VALPQRPFAPNYQQATWARGKVLGGSSAINGMIYNRGSQADFDHLAELGLKHWSWDQVVSAYREIEDNALGASATRGSGGPLHVSRLRGADPVCDEILHAGGNLGWRRTRECSAGLPAPDPRSAEPGYRHRLVGIVSASRR
jgi:choline dehydrogenase